MPSPASPSPSPRKPLTKRRSLFGQGLVEVCVGVIFLVFMGLAIMDLGVFVMGGDICGGLAKQAARAAANVGAYPAGNPQNQTDAATAMAAVGTQFRPTSMYKNVQLALTNYDNSTTGTVSVVCSVIIVLPVAVPLLGVQSEYQIKTQATEPIVGIAPAPPT